MPVKSAARIDELKKARKNLERERECKKIKTIEFTMAFNAYDANNYIPIEGEELDHILPFRDDVERTVMRKELYESLSDEAKEVLSLIYQAPQEIVDVLKTIKLTGSTTGLVQDRELSIFNKKRLMKYFRIKWKTREGARLLVRNVFKELKQFVDDLN